MANYASNDPFNTRTLYFLKWLRDRPSTTISRKLEVNDLRAHNAGRGVGKGVISEPFVSVVAEAPAVAVEDVEEDEELFTIAQSDILTVQNSTLQQVRPHLLERLDSWNSLVLAMIFEDGMGEKSTWWNYLQLLPTHFDVCSFGVIIPASGLDHESVDILLRVLTLLQIRNADSEPTIQTLLYWSSSELAELEGSAVLNKIKKDDADESFKRSLLPIVQQHAGLFGRHAQGFAGSNAYTVLLDLAHRMASLIMAYGFDIDKETLPSEKEDGKEDEEADGSSQLAYELNKGMVPLADLFNAGMSEVWSDFFLMCIPNWVLRRVLGAL